MAVNWTREQKQVIEGREKSLLVSAAAGSGKTAVLVERIIQMITEGENPKDIDRLLVMTFTRAAAAEMRERIQAAIEKKLESEPENEHLQQQAVLVQFAQITTIDSFCLHIMREHFDRLDIDPAFRVGLKMPDSLFPVGSQACQHRIFPSPDHCFFSYHFKIFYKRRKNQHLVSGSNHFSQHTEYLTKLSGISFIPSFDQTGVIGDLT